jgi:hemerythrin-like domain-containing protein
MMPVDLLIVEHRLIEKILKPMQEKREKMEETGVIDANFVIVAVDFFRTYADSIIMAKKKEY